MLFINENNFIDKMLKSNFQQVNLQKSTIYPNRQI